MRQSPLTIRCAPPPVDLPASTQPGLSIRSSGVSFRAVAFQEALGTQLESWRKKGNLGRFGGGRFDSANLAAWPKSASDMASLLSDPWDGSDVAMILGVVLFCGACVVGTNLRVDLLHQWIDPRVKPTH